MTPAPGASACPRCLGRHRITEELATDHVFTPDLVEFMASFQAYQAHGILPHAGGRDDQPATWLDAATYLEAILADFREAERQEAEERRRRHQQRAARRPRR